jgi:enterochelin esterase-like enzyme
MLEPQSTLLFALLITAFAALMWWMVKSRHALVKVLAAAVAFSVATMFGIMTVNKYFGYYQTWGAAIADLSGSGSAAVQVPDRSLLNGSWHRSLTRHTAFLELAERQGYTMRLAVAGTSSHITRTVYIYLPPQYFQPGYAHYEFPVIELIHGQPGEPQDWISVLGVTTILDQLVNRKVASPAVLVMPDANGGERVSLQCLNQVGGPQDMTYLGIEVPNAISHLLRVQPPGPAWGIAGYSEGGFCAANMALQPRLRSRYGFAASLSGYFMPFPNTLHGRSINPFGDNRQLRIDNSPLDEVAALLPGTVVPRFWLGAGTGDADDVRNAEYFRNELEAYSQPRVPLVLVPGLHTAGVWRADLVPMLEWMTRGLAGAAAHSPSGPLPVRVTPVLRTSTVDTRHPPAHTRHRATGHRSRPSPPRTSLRNKS